LPPLRNYQSRRSRCEDTDLGDRRAPGRLRGDRCPNEYPALGAPENAQEPRPRSRCVARHAAPTGCSRGSRVANQKPGMGCSRSRGTASRRPYIGHSTCPAGRSPSASCERTPTGSRARARGRGQRRGQDDSRRQLAHTWGRPRSAAPQERVIGDREAGLGISLGVRAYVGPQQGAGLSCW
jgi:hypothetical protein